jgi:hypothetical protein
MTTLFENDGEFVDVKTRGVKWFIVTNLLFVESQVQLWNCKFLMTECLTPEVVCCILRVHQDGTPVPKHVGVILTVNYVV